MSSRFGKLVIARTDENGNLDIIMDNDGYGYGTTPEAIGALEEKLKEEYETTGEVGGPYELIRLVKTVSPTIETNVSID